MRRSQTDKLKRVNDLRLLPEHRKKPLISGNEVVRAGRVGTLQEAVVIGIAADLKTMRRRNRMATVQDQLQELPADPLANLKLGTRQDFSILPP